MTTRSLSVALAAALTLTACSTARQRDLATYGALAAADAATTYYALEHGAAEANPILRVAGDDAVTVALTSAAVSFAVAYLLDRHQRERGHDARAWRTLNLVRAFGVAWNLNAITKQGEETP